MADATYTPKTYRKQGGDEFVVASGGLMTFEAGGGMTGPAEVVTATNVITAAESGTTYYLSALAGFVSTLPAPALGLRYRFVVKTAPTSNGYVINSESAANIIFGVCAVATEDDVGAIASQEDTITFVHNSSLPGDWCEVVSDGTNWYVTGCATLAESLTTTQAA